MDDYLWGIFCIRNLREQCLLWFIYSYQPGQLSHLFGVNLKEIQDYPMSLRLALINS